MSYNDIKFLLNITEILDTCQQHDAAKPLALLSQFWPWQSCSPLKERFKNSPFFCGSATNSTFVLFIRVFSRIIYNDVLCFFTLSMHRCPEFWQPTSIGILGVRNGHSRLLVFKKDVRATSVCRQTL